MQWTYLTYTLADYGITFCISLVDIVGVFATFFKFKKGQEFIIERVIGVNPSKAHDDYDEQLQQEQHASQTEVDKGVANREPTPSSIQIKQKSFRYTSIYSVVYLEERSFRLLPYSCFVFGESAFAPVCNTIGFICRRSIRVLFAIANISDPTAWCYGWIIRLQTTKSVLDQLGVAFALIGFCTTMMAINVYLGKCKKTIGLSIILILCSSGMIIILLIFKWSFSPLIYAILALGVGLGIFGLALYGILPKRLKTKGQSKQAIRNMNATRIFISETARANHS
jgi:hypothetical protein